MQSGRGWEAIEPSKIGDAESFSKPGDAGQRIASSNDIGGVIARVSRAELLWVDATVRSSAASGAAAPPREITSRAGEGEAAVIRIVPGVELRLNALAVTKEQPAAGAGSQPTRKARRPSINPTTTHSPSPKGEDG